MGNPRVLSVGKAWLRSWMGRTQWKTCQGRHACEAAGLETPCEWGEGKAWEFPWENHGNVYEKFWWESLVIFMGKFRGDLMFISNELGEERRERVRRATFVVTFVYVTHVQC